MSHNVAVDRQVSPGPFYEQLIDRHHLCRGQVVIVVIILMAMMVDGIGIHLLSDVAPIVIAEWRLTTSQFGPAMAGSLIGMIFGTVAGGWLGDRFGPRRILISATVLFGLSTIAASFSAVLQSLILMRMISGLGFGAAAPNAIALAVDWIPGRSRTKVLALLSVSAPLGGALGAGMAAMVIPAFGWRGCFVASGIIAILAAVLVTVRLPEALSYLRRSGAEDKILRLLKKNTGIEVFDRPPLTTQTFRIAPKLKRPIISTLYWRVALGTSLSNFLLHVASLGIVAWATVYLTAHDFTIRQALQTVMLCNLCAAAGALCSAYLIEIFGTKRLLVFSLTVATACIILVAIALGDRSDDFPSKIVVQIALALAMFLIGMCMTAQWAIMAHGYAPEFRGTGLGIGLTLGRLGILTILLSGGSLIALDPNLSYFFTAIIVALIGAVLSTFITDRHVRSKNHLPES